MLHSARLVSAAATGVLGLGLVTTAASADPVKFDFWYGLSGDLSNVVQQMCSDFNKSQSDYQIVCTSQTDYDTNLQNTIAAYRANKQPTITQIYDVGTATMLLSGAVKPVIASLTRLSSLSSTVPPEFSALSRSPIAEIRFCSSLGGVPSWLAVASVAAVPSVASSGTAKPVVFWPSLRPSNCCSAPTTVSVVLLSAGGGGVSFAWEKPLG